MMYGSNLYIIEPCENSTLKDICTQCIKISKDESTKEVCCEEIKLCGPLNFNIEEPCMNQCTYICESNEDTQTIDLISPANQSCCSIGNNCDSYKAGKFVIYTVEEILNFFKCLIFCGLGQIYGTG